MLMSEFVERTGFTPTAEEYVKIEKSYYTFDGDKDAFCKAFAACSGADRIYRERAEEIERLRSELVEMEKRHRAEVEDRDRRIGELTEKLDRELEWKPAENVGTNIDQNRYEDLYGYGRKMTDDEAKALIADECGFSADKITIRHTARTYEVNKHRELRVSDEYEREPIYESTDWNYVRFDCASFMYEYINGELEFYFC